MNEAVALPPLPEGFVLDEPKAELPPLPEGFTLDAPVASTALPPLPDGFTLDEPGKVSAAPVPVEEPGYLDSAANIAKGIGEQTVDLFGQFGNLIAATAPSDEDGVVRALPSFMYSDKGKPEESLFPTKTELQKASQEMRDFNLGYVPGTTWEQVKENPTAGNILGFALEQGLISTPDMAASVFALPGYVAARTGGLAQDRAVNDGLASARPEDLLKVLPASTATALLDRFGARSMFGLDDVAIQSLKEVPAEAAKAAVKEGATEALQEGVESTATTLGTEAGFDPMKTGDQMLAGAVGGAPVGGAVRTASATVEALSPDPATPNETSLPTEGIEGDAVETAVLPSEAPATQDGGEDVASPLRASPPSAISPEERAILRRTSIPDEDIDLMSREEVDAKVAEAIAAGIKVNGAMVRKAEQYQAPQAVTPENIPIPEPRPELVAQSPQMPAESVSPVEAPVVAPQPLPAPVAQPEPELTPEIQSLIADTVRQSIEADQAQQVEQAVSPVLPQLQQAVRQSVAADQDAEAEQAIAPVRPQLSQTVQASVAEDQDQDAERAVAPVLPQLSQTVEQSVSEDIKGDGTRRAPVVVQAPQHVEVAAQKVNTQPSEAQKVAGNYKHGHLKLAGLDIAIETPKGAVRSGTDPNGQQWSVELPAHYGRIKGTVGADKDQVDVYVGDNPSSKRVYVIDQKDLRTRRFDEHKAIMGVSSVSEARDLYTRAFSDKMGADRIGGITPMSVSEFRKWLRDGDTTKPLSMGKPDVRLNDQGFPVDRKGRVKKPDSLMEFIARRGGVHEETGELRAMGLTDRKTGFVVGAGPVVRARGMHPDKAREAAAEAGYLPMDSTLADFYDALDLDTRNGRQVFSQYDDDWTAAWRGEQGVEAEAAAEGSHEATQQEVRDRLASEGFPVDGADDFIAAVARLVSDGKGFDDAVELAYLDAGKSLVEPTETVAGIPFFGDDREVQPGTAPESGPVDRETGELDAGREPEGGVEEARADRPVRGEDRTEGEGDGSRQDSERGDRESAPERQEPEREGSERPQPVKAPVASWVVREKATGDVVLETFNKSTADAINKEKYEAVPVQEHLASLNKPAKEKAPAEERGADNKPQLVIPGAERATDADMAQRKADAPLKPKAPQKDPGGLFSDEMDQKDLLDLDAAPSGWETADPGEPAILLSETEQKRVAGIVAKVAGIDPSFMDQIKVPAGSPGLAAWGKSNEDATAAGFYHPVRDVIVLALDTPSVRADKTAYHEAFHRIQNLFVDSRERKVLAAEEPRLRAIVAERGDHSAATVRAMSRREVEAESFGIWAQAMDKGETLKVHIGVRKVWAKIRDVLRRVRNYLLGRGYQSAEDVFAKAKSGEMKERAPRKREQAAPQFSLAPAVDSEAFKKWFGDSKVVDDKGKPLVVYHGSPDARFLKGEDAQFKGRAERFGMAPREDDGAFWFASSRATALSYADERRAFDYQNAEGGVAAFYVSLQNPLIIDGGGKEWREAQARGKTSDVIDQAREEGHDGVIIRNVRDNYNNDAKTKPTDTFVAFKPTQIKSINNRGTFDPNDPRIDFSIVERAPNEPIRTPEKARGIRLHDAIAAASKALTSKAKSKGSRFDRSNADDGESFGEYTTRKIVDYLDPVLQMQNKVGVKLNDLADAYLTARLAEGTIRHEIHQIDEKYVTPAIEELAKVGATEKDLHEFMYAMHAPERNRVVGLRNDEDSDLYKAATDPSIRGASGMSTNEAKEIIRELAKDREKFMGIRRASAHIRAMLDDGLKRQLKAGLINKATYERLTTQWQYYVPLRAESDLDGTGGSFPSKSRGFDVRGDEFKGATGRYTKADNVVVYAINNAEQSIIRVEKNKAATAALRFINEFDPQGESIAKVYWSDEPDQLGDITKAPPVYRRKLGKDGKVTNSKVNAFQMKDDVLAAKVGGKTYYMEFADPKVGLALKKMTFPELGVALKIVRKVSNWQSMVNTRMNPAFVPINFLRDVQTGATLALSKDFSTGEIAKMVTNIPKAWKALWNDARGKPGTGKWDNTLKAFKAAGGKITFDQYDTIEGTAKRLQKDMARITSQGVVGKTWKGFISLIEDLNDTIENGMRLAVFDASRARGETDSRAAFLARDLTVDFQKKGEMTPAMNSLYTFFNASVQGNLNFAKGVYRSRKIKVAMAGIMGAGLAQHFWNLAMAGDDDDGENAYLKMLRNEPWKFERSMVFFLPGSKEYVMIPLGFGMNAFWHLGMQGGAVTSGGKDFLPAMLDSTRVAFEAFNPLGSGGWVSMALPSVIDPVWELGTNENFAGNPIYPQENQYDPAPPPKSEQAFKSTSPVFRWGAETLNKISGGNEVLPGAIDVYPDSLEHLWGWFTGGVGRFVSQSVETANRAAALEFEPKKTPFIRSFYGEVDDHGKRSEYYAQREKVQYVKGKMKEFSESGDSEGLKEFVKDNQQEADAQKAFDLAEKQRRAINKKRRQIEKSEPDNAKALLKMLDEQELEIMNQARKQYFEAGKEN